ncbi:MAG: P-II family nitrogen regulator [Bacillota bacterium]
MKKIEIIIKAERFEELKGILVNIGATGLMLTNVMGFGNTGGFTQQYRGVKTMVQLLPKLRVEVAVKDEMVEPIIKEVTEKIKTDEVGGGKIFVYNVEDVVRIRTGERGEGAL